MKQPNFNVGDKTVRRWRHYVAFTDYKNKRARDNYYSGNYGRYFRLCSNRAENHKFAES